MKLTIDLEETWAIDDTIATCIREEVKDEVRRAVKRHLKNKEGELAKAVEAYARVQAKALEDKITGADVLG